MAKSKAKKIREKRMREGRMDPTKSRGIYALADLRTRKSKTKREKVYQNKYGELSSMDKNQLDDSSFYLSKACKFLGLFCLTLAPFPLFSNHKAFIASVLLSAFVIADMTDTPFAPASIT